MSLDLIINIELSNIYDNMFKLDNFLKNKYINFTINKILPLLFAYNKNKIQIKEVYLLELIYIYLKIKILKNYYSLSLEKNSFKDNYLLIEDNLFKSVLIFYAEGGTPSAYIDSEIYFSNENEYIPIPWFLFLELEIKVKCNECHCFIESKKCYKLTSIYKRKEYYSYNIYNLCLDCFKHKNIKKYKNYIGYDKNNYEFDIILTVPYIM